MQPAPEQAANPARNALAGLAKRRDQLVLMRAQEKNRRSEAEDRAMSDRIGRLIESSTVRSPKSRPISAP
ncbi:hypothetical protein QUU41_22545, partial [Xanthomonas citri pv. citri]